MERASHAPPAFYTPRAVAVVGLAVGALAAFLVAIGEPIAALVVVGTPAIPFLVFAALRSVSGDRAFGSILAAALIFILSANFRYRDYGEKSIDFQVAIKLLAIALTLCLGVAFIKSITRNLYTNTFASWLTFYFVLVMSSTYAMSPLHAAVSTVSLIASFLFAFYMCIAYGATRVIEIFVWTGFALCGVSLVVYFAVPSFGRMYDWVGTEQVLTNRLQGILSSANGAGLAGGTLFLFTIFYYWRQPFERRWVTYGTLASSLLCVLLSNNRMAIVCLGASATLYVLLVGHFARKLLFVACLAVLASIPLLLWPEEIFSLLSRRGDAGEITSGTGRSRIWSVVLELVPKAWLLGYGYASAQHILPEHPDLFLAAAHTHNLYLEVLFHNGVVGLAAFTWCILITIVLAVRVGGARELALFFFFLPYGLTEPILGSTTYFAIMLWQTSIAFLSVRAHTIVGSRR